MASSHPPSTDIFPWSPIEIFQYAFTEPEKYLVWNEDDMLYHAKHRSVYKKVRENALKYAKSYDGQINYLTQIRNTPNLFTIAIGVWKKVHKGSILVEEGEDGEEVENKQPDIDYEELFRYLQEGYKGKNYDPLKIIREARDEINKQIKTSIDELFAEAGEKGTRILRSTIKKEIMTIAEQWRNRVRDYIIGGEAPALSRYTIQYYRPRKGIEGTTPLLATGQLLDAIKCEVYVEQTKDFRRHADAFANMLKSRRKHAMERARKIARETLASKATKPKNGKAAPRKRYALTKKEVEKEVRAMAKRKLQKTTLTKEIIEDKIRADENIREQKLLMKQVEEAKARFESLQALAKEKYGSWDATPSNIRAEMKSSYNFVINKTAQYRIAKQFLETHGGQRI